MNQRSETSSSLFLDTAHGETVSSIVVFRRIHAATEEEQAVTVILAVRRCTPIVAAAAHAAHVTVDAADQFLPKCISAEILGTTNASYNKLVFNFQRMGFLQFAFAWHVSTLRFPMKWMSCAAILLVHGNANKRRNSIFLILRFFILRRLLL